MITYRTECWGTAASLHCLLSAAARPVPRCSSLHVHVSSTNIPPVVWRVSMLNIINTLIEYILCNVIFKTLIHLVCNTVFVTNHPDSYVIVFQWRDWTHVAWRNRESNHWPWGYDCLTSVHWRVKMMFCCCSVLKKCEHPSGLLLSWCRMKNSRGSLHISFHVGAVLEFIGIYIFLIWSSMWSACQNFVVKSSQINFLEGKI